MIGRIIWLAALLALALITGAAQIDRQARVTPSLANAVPEPFRGFAQARIAARAIAGEDTARALAEAKRLVARRPIPAEHLRLLAAAQIEAGLIEESAVTVQVAARRGWRDAPSQQAMLRLALAAGDRPEAARRYAALLVASRTEEALLEELGALVFAEPDESARATFAEIVAAGERWHDYYLRRAARVMPPATMVDVTEAAIADGARFDCRAVDLATGQLTRRDPEAGKQFADLFSTAC
ncbi:hypothetical protein [Erythrobacter sp. JK5]|uniref:hypothetical protein n=1 Tax=Erythrobacter sp. JK5 TaxID=2829500 RepID=UPI001BA5840F|nr:hypothetical protein [Erythrobacter sp. JK5]QUL37649.1 hypothetical protein KDC96_15090 [Erythrobacter sp. JK5]